MQSVMSCLPIDLPIIILSEMAGLSADMELSRMASRSAFNPPKRITREGNSNAISHRISIQARYSRSRGTFCHLRFFYQLKTFFSAIGCKIKLFNGKLRLTAVNYVLRG